MGPAALLELRPQAPARAGAGGRQPPISHVLDRGHARSVIRRSAKCRTHRGIADPGDAIIVDGTSGSIYVRPRRKSNRPMRSGCGFAARAAGAIFGVARQALRHQRRPGGRIDDQCGPWSSILPHIDDNRQRRHWPVPHRAAVHDRTEPAAHQRSARALPHGAGRCGLQAGDVPHPRHRRRQGAALYGDRDRGKIRRSAGARSGSGSTGPDCCAARFARCYGPAAGAHCASCFR